MHCAAVAARTRRHMFRAASTEAEVCQRIHLQHGNAQPRFPAERYRVAATWGSEVNWELRYQSTWHMT